MSRSTTFKAYATNSAGTAYGDEKIFSTLPELPQVNTIAPTTINATSVWSCGGNVISDAGSPVTECGVCFSTSNNPTIYDSKQASTFTGIGSYYVDVNGLTPHTTYYLRAYAINSGGTGYGNVTVFTTVYDIPTVITTTVNTITNTTAKSGGNVTKDGGSPVTERGVCWSSTWPWPTIGDFRTIDGTGTGVYTSTLTGLTPNTQYYCRAYATNAMGTAYGDYSSFKTPSK